MKAKPPDLLSREDALVEDGAAAPKACLQSLEDSHNNSRRWLSSHRQNLCGNGDHLQRVTSSVLRDRRDELEEEKNMDFNSIRLVRQQLLETACCSSLPEGYREKNDAKYDVRSRRFSRSSPRLPVLGVVARFGLW